MYVYTLCQWHNKIGDWNHSSHIAPGTWAIPRIAWIYKQYIGQSEH